MADEAVIPAAAPAVAATPDLNNPNTVIHAPETPAAPVVPQTPEIPQDYRVNTLENGMQEVVLNSGQVYRGTAEQVINELAKAQFNASRHITELKGQIPAAPTTPVDNGPQIDPTAKALADLVAQGEGFRDSAHKMETQRRIVDSYEQQHINNLAANFIATTPDFFPSTENGDKVDATLKQFGLEATPDTLKLVHNHLKATGQYVAPPAGQQQQRSAPMPMPPNGYQVQPQGQPTEAELWAMPFSEFEKRMRQGN